MVWIFSSYWILISILGCGNSSTSNTKSRRPKLVCCGAYEKVRNCEELCIERKCPNPDESDTETTDSYRSGEFCDCEDNYARNGCGKCVRRKKCADGCVLEDARGCMSVNETSDGCYDPHNEPTCKNREASSESCVLGVCHCKKGYVRNSRGICILPKDCHLKYKEPNPRPCSDPNEEYAKGKCETNCDCRAGYVRNTCGKCVRNSDGNIPTPCSCTNPCPGKHEISRCVISCQRRNCDFRDYYSRCIPVCKQECDCIEGYRRIEKDLTSKCIPEKQCPLYPDFHP